MRADHDRAPRLLIDASHKPWIVGCTLAAVASLAAYVGLGQREPDGLRAGSTPGLWLGVAGTACMVFAGLLPAIRKFPRRRLPYRRWWLKGHIWLGLLSVVLILCHAGFRIGGPLEQALLAVFGVTILSGVLGLVFQTFLPRRMTVQVPCEVPFEQIPHACRVLRGHADDLVESICGPYEPGGGQSYASGGHAKLTPETKARFRELYEAEVRPFLSDRPVKVSRLSDPLRSEEVFAEMNAMPEIAAVAEEAAKLRTFCTERRLLAEQERLHRWLHGWLLVHVPVSAALLGLGVAHVWTAMRY